MSKKKTMNNSNSSQKKPFVVVVDGIIAAGKSTYIEMLNLHLRKRGWKVTVVKEPVDGWVSSGILERFYNDTSRWGYHFQTRTFTDRIMANCRAYEENPDSDIFILERSPMTDPLFMEMLHDRGSIDDLEFADYQSWGKLWYKLMPYQPNLFVYLTPSVEKCMERLAIRNREGEGGIEKDYQIDLQKKHDQIFSQPIITIGNGQKAKCVQISTEKDFKNNPQEQERMVEEFILLADSAVKHCWRN